MRIVLTKHDLSWHIANWYLYNLGGLNCVDDVEFDRLYKQLWNYVDSKISTCCDGDIIDEYVIVAQEEADTLSNGD